MLETMHSAPGIGLAAVQIGILKRLIVIDISKENEKNPLFDKSSLIKNQKRLRSMRKDVITTRSFC